MLQVLNYNFLFSAYPYTLWVIETATPVAHVQLFLYANTSSSHATASLAEQMIFCLFW